VVGLRIERLIEGKVRVSRMSIRVGVTAWLDAWSIDGSNDDNDDCVDSDA
jgi:hypothetical protein